MMTMLAKPAAGATAPEIGLERQLREALLDARLVCEINLTEELYQRTNASPSLACPSRQSALPRAASGMGYRARHPRWMKSSAGGPKRQFRDANPTDACCRRLIPDPEGSGDQSPRSFSRKRRTDPSPQAADCRWGRVRAAFSSRLIGGWRSPPS